MRTIELLKKMDRILATENNWTQGYLEHNDKVCLLGAAYQAATGFADPNDQDRLNDDPIYRVGVALNFKVNHSCDTGGFCLSSHMTEWNDDDKRTFTDVKKRIQKAIKRYNRKLKK